VVKEPARAGSTTLVVENAAGFPESGVVKIGNDLAIDYTRTGNVLSLSSPLKNNVPAGTVVTIGDSRVIRVIGEGSGCSLSAPESGHGFIPALGWLLIGFAVLRRR
jgi:hypothetical protein